MVVHSSFLRVSPVPHIHAPVSTRKIMGNVILALVPALVASTLIFGWRSLLVVAVTVAACVLCEYLWCRLRKQPQTISDLSAVVTGLLLAFNLPPSVPLYLPVIGAIAAIIVTKSLFGGIGCNFANPAIVGRITLAVSFPALMTRYSFPETACDALTSATPLAVKTQPLPLSNLLLGTHGGVIGETCALALLLGLVWLLGGDADMAGRRRSPAGGFVRGPAAGRNLHGHRLYHLPLYPEGKGDLFSGLGGHHLPDPAVRQHE